jgi:hypothetical protein
VAVLVLGCNLWASTVLLPGLFTGTWSSGPRAGLMTAPLVPLLAGVVSGRAALLLFAFPTALLLPAVVVPELVTSQIYGASRFLFVAGALVAYLAGGALACAEAAPPAPERVRKLSSASTPVAAHWQRRLRVYRALFALSLLFPAALVHAVHFDAGNRAFLREMFPGRVQLLTTLLDLGVMALWLVLYHRYFLGPLGEHRAGDRALLLELERLQRQARRSRPRPGFYVGVVAALVFMALLLYTRYR